MQFLQFTTVVSCWVASLQLQVQTFSVFYIFIKRKDSINIYLVLLPQLIEIPWWFIRQKYVVVTKWTCCINWEFCFIFRKKVQQHVEGNCQNKTKGSNWFWLPITHRISPSLYFKKDILWAKFIFRLIRYNSIVSYLAAQCQYNLLEQSKSQEHLFTWKNDKLMSSSTIHLRNLVTSHQTRKEA